VSDALKPDASSSAPTLSIVIPSYNSANWLPTTFAALAKAVNMARLPVQVVVVDDGSIDDTGAVVAELAASFPGVVELYRQENRGRFLARWVGLERARSRLTLLLDSRVLIDPDSLVYLFHRLAEDPAATVWNGHVRTDASAPLVGRFWEVPTHIFWAGYLRRPRPMDITPENFDSVPKGTGTFLAPTELLRDAFRATWPSDDARLVSDDTKLLRWLVEAHPIRLDPGFSAVYRPRTTLNGFVSHTYDRGTLFVDSYAGTTPLRSMILVALAVLPVVFFAAIIALALSGLGSIALVAVVVAVLVALAPLVPAALNRCPPRALLAYVVVLPIFIVPFWIGLARGLVIHRQAFFKGRGDNSTISEETNPT
jgi:hypothetical protein